MNQMLKNITAVLLATILLTGCADQPAGTGNESVQGEPASGEQRTARGVLRHFPSDVKSVEAWRGHNFLVGETPVLPTAEVPEETLLGFVGSEVVVGGVWYPGEPWIPGEEELLLASPEHAAGEPIVRGDGLRAASIERVE